MHPLGPILWWIFIFRGESSALSASAGNATRYNLHYEICSDKLTVFLQGIFRSLLLYTKYTHRCHFLNVYTIKLQFIEIV